MIRFLFLFLAVFCLQGGGADGSATPQPPGETRAAAEPGEKRIDLSPVRRWVGQQAELKSVASRFVQTRSLRALKSPVAVPGRLWFEAPGTFRWELGEPAKSVLIRKGEVLELIQPERKRAKRMSVRELAEQSGLRGMALMEFPVAKDFEDFKRQFEVLSLELEGERCALAMVPRDPAAKRFLRRVEIVFERGDGRLVEFGMTFRDGSSMRNRFTEVHLNRELPAGLFDYDFTGYSFADAGD